jgi:hypothetical protein
MEWQNGCGLVGRSYQRLDDELYMGGLIICCFIENEYIHASYPIHVLKKIADI